MHEYEATTYGDRIADVYDEWPALPADAGAAVDCLASLAGSGPCLELGIGTGRVALPLAQQGLKVHGIDASEAMVAKLRAKPGGEAIPMSIGNFADVAVEGHFSLIFVVFNTIFALESQEEQVQCFANAANHLADGGLFLLEAFVPDLTRYTLGQHTQTHSVELDRVLLEVARLDPVAQQIVAQHVVLAELGIRLYPVKIRYAWPSELDLMARLAGLRLEERWSGWGREAFTGASTRHISVYGRA